MTISVTFILIIYIGVIVLFAWYSFINVKQTKTIEEWNERTDHIIESLSRKTSDLESRLHKLETDLNGSIIEPEHDFKNGEGK